MSGIEPLYYGFGVQAIIQLSLHSHNCRLSRLLFEFHNQLKGVKTMLLQKPWPRIVQANVEVWIYTIHDAQDCNTSRSDSFKRFSLPSVSDSVFSQELPSAYYASTYSATQHSRDISRILAQPKYFCSDSLKSTITTEWSRTTLNRIVLVAKGVRQ